MHNIFKIFNCLSFMYRRSNYENRQLAHSYGKLGVINGCCDRKYTKMFSENSKHLINKVFWLRRIINVCQKVLQTQILILRTCKLINGN